MSEFVYIMYVIKLIHITPLQCVDNTKTNHNLVIPRIDIVNGFVIRVNTTGATYGAGQYIPG